MTRIFAAIALGIAATVVLVGPSPAHASCPSGLNAARMVTESWTDPTMEAHVEHVSRVRSEDLSVPQPDATDIVLDIALWPFDDSSSGDWTTNLRVVFGDSVSGTVVLAFRPNGDVDMTIGEGSPILISDFYTRGAWNDVRLRFDLSDDQLTATLNGQAFTTGFAPGSTAITYVGISTDADASFGSGEELVGYADSIRVARIVDGQRTTYYSEDFEDGASDLDAGPGTLQIVEPPWTFAAESECKIPSYLSVRKEVRRHRIDVWGALRPSGAGRDLKVTLFEKQGGEFIKAEPTRTVSLNDASRYETSFERPDASRCRVVSKLPATMLRLPAIATKTFRC